jgi:hypothetical protein
VEARNISQSNLEIKGYLATITIVVNDETSYNGNDLEPEREIIEPEPEVDP